MNYTFLIDWTYSFILTNVGVIFCFDLLFFSGRITLMARLARGLSSIISWDTYKLDLAMLLLMFCVNSF